MLQSFFFGTRSEDANKLIKVYAFTIPRERISLQMAGSLFSKKSADEKLLKIRFNTENIDRLNAVLSIAAF